MPSNILRIVRPSWMKRDSEFWQDNLLVGRLQYESSIGSKCTGYLHEQEIVIERKGTFRSEISITQKEFSSEHIISIVGNSRMRLGKRTMPIEIEGDQYVLTGNFWQTHWQWLNASGEELAAFKYSIWGANSVVIHPTYANTPRMLLLIMLGWYMLQELQRDQGAAA